MTSTECGCTSQRADIQNASFARSQHSTPRFLAHAESSEDQILKHLLDLVEHYDPRAYRMLLLQSHYRGPVSVGQDNIDSSVKALARFDG